MLPKAFFHLSMVLASYSIVSTYARRCDDKQIIESVPLVSRSGGVITMERFNCSNTEPIEQVPLSAKTRRHPLDLRAKRSTAQCTTTNCICGIPCFFNHCFAVVPTETIHGSDCTALSESLTNTPGTFTIPAGQGVGFVLESCQYVAFGPSATEPSEYCFDDMGVAATEVFDVCGATQQGSCGGTFNGGSFFVDQLSIG